MMNALNLSDHSTDSNISVNICFPNAQIKLKWMQSIKHILFNFQRLRFLHMYQCILSSLSLSLFLSLSFSLFLSLPSLCNFNSCIAKQQSLLDERRDSTTALFSNNNNNNRPVSSSISAAS